MNWLLIGPNQLVFLSSFGFVCARFRFKFIHILDICTLFHVIGLDMVAVGLARFECFAQNHLLNAKFV